MFSEGILEHLQETKVVDFLDELEIPAYVVDKNRRIVFWNKQATKLTGYEANEVVGKFCAEQVLNHVDRTGIPVCNTELCPLYQSKMVSQFKYHLRCMDLPNQEKGARFQLLVCP
ncbi:PAS domain-containing protein [Fervidobacterium pennivorans]|uniref:PAS domain-containing protein n=1 Tax=Fervidobacterium pennivorans TaxID=93466 RepID=UPI001436B3E8|nr:PAS domain-containing protein [Fervidobacterium pennivorans]QIV77999.1 PAS domain-containing protein [Fervidobacterium pennivorans subsp. keratinolyticus]